jgi:predicted nuclease of predicted toxin-antitoxin system
MKFLFDMNLSPRWVAVFESAGLPAVHWAEIGAPTASDREIMSHARAHGWVVVTHDLDFTAILAATQARGPSVVQIRARNLDPSILGPVVVRAVAQERDALHTGALLAVRGESARLRLLPLHDA